jgi:hypothetical protein
MIHLEGHVARKRAVGRCYLDWTGFRTDGYPGLDQAIRELCEESLNAVKRDRARLPRREG